MKHPLLLTLVLTCALSTQTRAQASTDNPLISHIPTGADKVYHINYISLSGKLDWKTLLAALPKKPENQQFLSFLSDPASVGIDPRPGVIVAESNAFQLDSPRYTTILIALTDSGKYLSYFMKAGDKSKFHILPGKTRTARQGDKTFFSWNDKLMVITTIKPPVSANPAVPGTDNTTYQFGPKVVASAMHRTIAAQKGFPTSRFLTDAAFREAFADDADVHTWSRSGSGLGMMTDAMRLAKAPINAEMLQTMKNMKQIHSQSLTTISFGPGVIRVHNKIIYDSLQNFSFGSRPLNTDLIDRLPQGNLLGLVTLHIDPAGYLQMLQTMQGGKGMHSVDSMLAKKNLTADDILSAFKGDALVAVLGNKAAPGDTSTKLPKPSIFVVLTINDQAKFTKVNNALHLTPDNRTEQDTPTSKPKMLAGHTLRDNILVLGSDQQAADDYFDKPGHAGTRLLSPELKATPIALAIDVKAISDYVAPSLKPKDQIVKVILGLFDQITLAMADLHGNQNNTTLEIKMTDQQQNSLTTISQLVSSMSGGK